MTARKPFPFVNEIREYVIDEFLHRKQSYPNNISTPFVRLTSTKEDPQVGYKFFTLGLHGYTNADNQFDLVYGNRSDLVGYGYSVKDTADGFLKKRLVFADELTREVSPLVPDSVLLGSPVSQERLNAIQQARADQQQIITAKGTQPSPGITSIDVHRRGIGTPISARVTWVCYNRQQLEFLRNHFMVAGTYAVIEFGQQFADRQVTNILNFSDPNILSDLEKCITGGRNYIIDTYCKPNSGNYDLFVGIVGNYTIGFDAEKNIYTVTTTIYSTGEQYWGLSTYVTSISPTQTPGSTSTMYDFFIPEGGEFSRICADISAISNGYIADIKNVSNPDNVLQSKDFGLLGSYGDDSTFVRWDYFVTTVMDKLFSSINSPDIQSSIQKFTSFYKLQQELEASSSLDEKNPRISYVGDSPELVSCNPDALIIIRGNKPNVPAFARGGLFGNGQYGVLGKGVWINSNAIRRAFATSTTFDMALRILLNELNMATAGFWNLRLFYDEDLALLKVIDEKHDLLPDKLVLYKFNVGTQGETFELNMESAFPPELISQLALAASFKTRTREDRARLLSTYPLLGTTCHAGFALNWTNLIDVLDQQIRNKTQTTIPAATGAAISPANTPDAVVDTRVRVAGTTNTLPIVQNETNRAPETTIGGTSINQPTVNPSMQVPDGTQAQVKLSPTDLSSMARSKRYEDSITKWCSTYGVDSSVIKAIIKNESNFDHTAWRQNASLFERYKDTTSTMLLDPRNSQAIGLGQVLGSKAKELGVQNLEEFKTNPDEQIRITVLAFKSFYDSTFNIATNNRERLHNAISAYNGGFAPKYGFGRPFPADTTAQAPCVVWDEADSTKCVKRGSVVPGQYGNQEYVNKVVNDSNKFRLSEPVETQPIAPPVDDQSIVTQSNINQQNVQQPDTSDPNTILEAEYRNKFGPTIMAIIEPNRTELMRRLLQEGMNRSPLPSNNFIAPFPTTSAVELTLLGISGLSVSDAFLVDKLPFIFEEYGCFQIVEISDSVTTSGWKTKIRGYFKFMWMDGAGATNVGRTSLVY